MGIDGRAVTSSKVDEIEEAKAPAPGIPPLSYLVTDETLSEMKVRTYGDAAVVTGLSMENVLINGKDATVRYRRTTVYIKQPVGGDAFLSMQPESTDLRPRL